VIPHRWWPYEYGIMDYHLHDLNGDGSKDLLLVVTDYRSWRLAFILNLGLDDSGRVVWQDVSEEVNVHLIAQGLCHQPWPRYLSIQDVNGDGIGDVFPQVAFSSGEGWMLIGSEELLNFTYRSYPIAIWATDLSAAPVAGGGIGLEWNAVGLEERGLGTWTILDSPFPFGDRSSVQNQGHFATEQHFMLSQTTPGRHYIRVGWTDAQGIMSPLSAEVSVDLEVEHENQKPTVPNTFVLESPYPNPFHGRTQVTFGLPEVAWVRITASDLLGRQVAMLIAGETKAAGYHTVQFNADGLASGTYLIRMEVADFEATQNVLLLR
jgi:hypothetical protein